MISRFFKLLVIGFLIIGVVYLGACVYANFIQSSPGEYKLPPIDKAQYEVIINNTNNVLYTNTYGTNGTEVILQGYWEFIGNKYKYRDNQITLDKKVFGEIIIRRR